MRTARKLAPVSRDTSTKIDERGIIFSMPPVGKNSRRRGSSNALSRPSTFAPAKNKLRNFVRSRELLPFNPYLAFTLRLPSYAVQLLRETFPPPAIYPNPPGDTSSLSRRYERASPSSSSTGARAPSGILAASIVGSGAFPPLRCLQTFERLRQTVKSVPAENSR